MYQPKIGDVVALLEYRYSLDLPQRRGHVLQTGDESVLVRRFDGKELRVTLKNVWHIAQDCHARPEGIWEYQIWEYMGAMVSFEALEFLYQYGGCHRIDTEVSSDDGPEDCAVIDSLINLARKLGGVVTRDGHVVSSWEDGGTYRVEIDGPFDEVPPLNKPPYDLYFSDALERMKYQNDSSNTYLFDRLLAASLADPIAELAAELVEEGWTEERLGESLNGAAFQHVSDPSRCMLQNKFRDIIRKAK